jgi:hypothetical protein
VHLLVGGVGRSAGLVAEVAECGHDATGVGPHGRPDAAGSRRGGPLATKPLVLVEDDRLEALLLEIARYD